jgi:type II secretory pathway pseudopilin PulG
MKFIKQSKKYFPNKNAFTLTEMLTSIFIIVMITGIFMANYKDNNKRTDLIMTAQKMVADIRAAQNNSLGLVKYGDTFPAGGWAINFDKSTDESRSRYVVFADLDAPASDEPGREAPAAAGFGYFDSGEGLVNLGAKIVDLPRNIIIDSIQTDNNSNRNWVNVNFIPPDPTTYIFDGTKQVNWVKITLKDIQSEQSKIIFINFLGLAEVID